MRRAFSFYLENDGFDQRVDGGYEKLTNLAGALETPEDDAALAEYGEEVQHFWYGQQDVRKLNNTMFSSQTRTASKYCSLAFIATDYGV